MGADANHRCTVLGVEYVVADMAAATAAVVERALSGQGGYASLAGVHGVVTAQHRPQLKSALDDAWANLADGEPVAWMMRRLGATTARRVAGPDLMPSVIDAGQAHGLRHFMFGSTPEVLERLGANLHDWYPQAKIVGTMSPPFRPLTDDEECDITDQIRLERRPHRLGRAWPAQTGRVDVAERNPVDAVHGDGRGSRIRFSRRGRSRGRRCGCAAAVWNGCTAYPMSPAGSDGGTLRPIASSSSALHLN